MRDLDEITKVEERYALPSGEPSLGEAFRLLRERWSSGARDRETGLRLMFLAWYSCSEPTSLTGLPLERTEDIFGEVFRGLGGEQSEDAELLYAVAVMAGKNSFPWCCGDEATWLNIAARCTERFRALRPEGFAPADFRGRGAYGDYFAHMAAHANAAG